MRSVTTAYAFLLVIIFIITEIVYAANQNDSSWNCVLYNWGAKYTYAISRKGHIHRLLIPIILHSGFFHLFWNIFSLLMIGYSIEKAIGKWYKYVALIILGGIGGNIFSAVVDPYNIAVGASTSLYAITGAFIVWFYQHWSLLGPMRYQYIIFLSFMILFSFIDGLTMKGSGIDSWGHLGGLIFGILISIFLLPTP